MKKKYAGLLLIAALVLLLVGASVLYTRLLQANTPQAQLATQPEQSTEASAPGENTQPERLEAPDFTVYDGEGNPVKLTDFVGKPIVLNFWASWCGPCKMEMPDFQEKYLELGDSVQFLMINMTDGSRETVETASGFIAEQEYTFPVYYDTAYEAAYAYGVRTLPITYFIDAEGYLVAHAPQSISGEVLQKGIDMITS